MPDTPRGWPECFLRVSAMRGEHEPRQSLHGWVAGIAVSCNAEQDRT